MKKEQINSNFFAHSQLSNGQIASVSARYLSNDAYSVTYGITFIIGEEEESNMNFLLGESRSPIEQTGRCGIEGINAIYKMVAELVKDVFKMEGESNTTIVIQGRDERRMRWIKSYWLKQPGFKEIPPFNKGNLYCDQHYLTNSFPSGGVYITNFIEKEEPMKEYNMTFEMLIDALDTHFATSRSKESLFLRGIQYTNREMLSGRIEFEFDSTDQESLVITLEENGAVTYNATTWGKHGYFNDRGNLKSWNEYSFGSAHIDTDGNVYDVGEIGDDLLEYVLTTISVNIMANPKVVWKDKHYPVATFTGKEKTCKVMFVQPKRHGCFYQVVSISHDDGFELNAFEGNFLDIVNAILVAWEKSGLATISV